MSDEALVTQSMDVDIYPLHGFYCKQVILY